jgi:hypothetical protein
MSESGAIDTQDLSRLNPCLADLANRGVGAREFRNRWQCR